MHNSIHSQQQLPKRRGRGHDDGASELMTTGHKRGGARYKSTDKALNASSLLGDCVSTLIFIDVNELIMETGRAVIDECIFVIFCSLSVCVYAL